MNHPPSLIFQMDATCENVVIITQQMMEVFVMNFLKPKQHVSFSAAASLSLVLAAGVIGNANAGGQKASVDIFNACTVVAGYAGALTLRIDTTITDTSGDNGEAPIFGAKTVQAQEKTGKGPWSNFGTTFQYDPADSLGANPVMIPLCPSGLDSEAKAVNAMVSVEVTNSKKGTFSSRCDDDPSTPEDESRLDIEGVVFCP
jgi:hypothetical protein